MDNLLKVWLVVSQGIALVMLLGWLVMAPMSMMAFDAGFSWGGLASVAAIGGFPLAAIGGAIAAWRALRRNERRRAFLSTTLPLAYLPGVLGVLWVIERGF